MPPVRNHRGGGHVVRPFVHSDDGTVIHDRGGNRRGVVRPTVAGNRPSHRTIGGRLKRRRVERNRLVAVDVGRFGIGGAGTGSGIRVIRFGRYRGTRLGRDEFGRRNRNCVEVKRHRDRGEYAKVCCERGVVRRWRRAQKRGLKHRTPSVRRPLIDVLVGFGDVWRRPASIVRRHHARTVGRALVQHRTLTRLAR